MGDGRFLHNNLITDESMITVSSLRTGVVTAAKKNGTGSAVITVSGNFSGTQDLEYIVEIDSVAGGAEVGQATFKWSDGGGTWDASGITTDSVNTLLNNGVNVLWTSGAGADFVVADKWYFKGINLFNASKLIDLDRDTVYRSAALGAPNTITVDLGSAQEVKACILHDHNFTSAATLLLEGDDAATFDSDGGSAQFSEAITWASVKVLHYLSVATTRRYWRLSVTDAGNADGYIELGELYLGTYFQLSRNFSEGFSTPITLKHAASENKYGTKRRRFFNLQREFEYEWKGMVAADLTLLEGLINDITDKSTGIMNPFYWNEDSADSAKFWLVAMDELPQTHMTRSYYTTTLRLSEVVQSV